MQTIKTYILQHKLLSFLTGVILVLSAVLLFKSHKINKLSSQLNYQLYKDSVIHSTTRSGDSTITVYQTEYKYIPDQKKVDSLLDELRIAKRKAISTTDVATNTSIVKTEGTRTDTLYRLDTTQRTYQYSDPYLQYKATAGKTLKFEQFSLRDTINLVSAKNGTQTTVTAVTHNPYTTVSGLRSITLQQTKKPSSWSLGITAGATITNNGIHPGATIGITKTIFRF